MTPDDPQYPEHAKLNADRPKIDLLREVWDWCKNNKVKLCQQNPKPRKVMATCPECRGCGKKISKLDKRQAQVIEHYQLLELAERPWNEEKRDEFDAAMNELKTILKDADDCWSCRGEGVTEITVGENEMVWVPGYKTFEDFLLAYFGVDRTEYRRERDAMFAELRRQAGERPQAAQEAAV